VNQWRETYTYDFNNNLLTDLRHRMENGVWVNSYRYTYTYDTNGNQLTWLSEPWRNGAWVGEVRGTFNYDANENRLTELWENWQNSAWITTRRVTYTYDASGNQLTYLTEKLENGAWVNWVRYTYSYDSFNNTISASCHLWSNNSWVLTPNQCEFYYNNKQDNVSISSTTATATYQYITGVEDGQSEVASYELSQNYPNPFNPVTVVRFALPVAGDVSIVVYNSLGQEVATLVNGYQEAGRHTVTFDASKLTSGVYFYRLTTEQGSISKKMTLLK